MTGKTLRGGAPLADPGPDRQAGFTLVELLLGVTVFLVAAVVLGDHISSNFRATSTQQNQVFAYAKAHAILSEIHAMVDRGDVEAAVDLDILDDGVTPRPQLTVTTDESGVLLSPDHPVSGNTLRNAEWTWARQLSVRPFAGLDNRNVRYVTVRIFKRDTQGRLHELASLSSVVNSVSTSFPATQVFDVFLLAVENIPGWWVYMESIVPFVESAVTDLENRNPGLSVRTHWITKAGFGRNSLYRPYINDELDSRQTVDRVYFYPGKMPDGSASTRYYVPDLIAGRIRLEDSESGGWNSNTNPYPYALADFYNHCMRWPEAVAKNDERTTEAANRAEQIQLAQLIGAPPPDELDDMSTEPTLQVLLERMISEPDSYRHALLINLHGELLPVPALRNYSDPAKDPENLPGLRAVTHAEELRTQSPVSGAVGDQSVRLRVYCYKTDPNDVTIPDVVPWERAIVVNVMDMDLTDGTGQGRVHPDVDVLSIAGGVDVAGDYGYKAPTPAAEYIYSSTPNEMNYYAFFFDPGPGQRKMTRFYLFNTPTSCPVVADQGLYANRRSRLYGLEYVPAPVGPTMDFQRDLSATGDGPKNTARWIINVPPSMWDQQRFVENTTPVTYYDPRDRGEEDHVLEVRTTFWDLYDYYASLEAGTEPSGAVSWWFRPDNLSTTYSWWAGTRESVPWTERYQFFGDPRHNPYRDLLHGDPDFGDGYNWFHSDLIHNGEYANQDYPGLRRRYERYNGGPHFDVPRLLELYRRAIVGSGSIYTTLSGYSYYYVGCGNEIGYDSANGYPSSIPVNRKPWGGGDTSIGYVNNITSARCFVRESGVSDYWYGMPWLGELYPDDAYLTHWFDVDAIGTAEGNLPSGGGPGTFHRRNMQSVHGSSTTWRAFGTELRPTIHRTATRGCVSFFNNGTTSQHFNHHFSNGNGQLVGPGVELSKNYGFPIPASMYITRPFSVNTGGNVPPEMGLNPYAAERFRASIMHQYFNHPSGHAGSGLVQLVSPDEIDAAWIVVNGIATTTSVGSDFLAKYCLLSMYQSYFELGDQSLGYRIPQPPRIEIASPTEITELRNPASVPIQIDLTWERWDGLPYTTRTPSNYAEDETEVDYVVTYSLDNGVTFRYVQDDSPATVGTRPDNPALYIQDSGVGPQIVNWTTPTFRFPEGSYVLRVEAYRRSMALHYSVHQVRIYIQR